MTQGRAALLSMAATLVLARVANAQTAALTGTVLRDSSGTVLSGAIVTVAELTLSATTNYRGEFRLSRLPAGRVAVTIRAIGFVVLNDTVTLTDGAGVDREFVLQQVPQDLNPVVTKAPERKYISPGLQEFEERRTKGVGGYFISEEQLRKEQNRDMVMLLIGQIPNLTRIRIPPNQVYVGTARKCAAGPVFLNCRGGNSYCPVTLYIDGALVYSAKQPVELPNLQTYRIDEYAGVEYYPGGASMPVKYNATDSGCGVLLLWSRER
jgi:hypothetical protein